MNIAVLGQSAKEYRLAHNLSEKARIRDSMTAEQLNKIAAIESSASSLVQRDGICPKQAIKQAIASLA